MEKNPLIIIISSLADAADTTNVSRLSVKIDISTSWIDCDLGKRIIPNYGVSGNKI
jgi:hypothetical protein